MNYLISTTGTRDLCIKRQELEKYECFKLVEEQGENVRKQLFLEVNKEERFELDPNREDTSILYVKNSRSFGEYFDGNEHLLLEIVKVIDLPIIQPSIDYIINSGVQISNLKIFLVLTNNPEHVESKNRNKDTVKLFPIYRQWILQQNNISQTGNVKILSVNLEPTRIDEIYHYFSEQRPINFKNEERIFYHAQGGVDGLNFGLLFKLLEKYPMLVYLYKAENSEISEKLQFPQQFINNIEKQKMKNAVLQYDYEYLINSTDENAIVHLLAKIGRCWMNLDLDRIRKVVNEANNVIENRQIFRENPILSNLFSDKKEKLKLVYETAIVKLDQGAYGDYLWRIFLLKENMLIPSLEAYFDAEIIYDKRDDHKAWNTLLENDAHLLAHLKQVEVNNNPLNYKEPNTFTFESIISFVNENENEENSVDIAEHWKSLFKKITKLSNIRNRVAHQMGGASIELLNSELPNGYTLEDLNEELKGFLNTQHEDPSLNHFEQLNSLINSYLG